MTEWGELRAVEEKFQGWPSLVLENALLRVRVLVGKGSDIYELTYKPRAMDVLWKTPWGLRPPLFGGGTDSATNWLEQYGGGWQVLLPNGGDAGEVGGAPLPFHGEAAVRPWVLDDVTQDDTTLTAQMHYDGFVSPVRLTRTLTLTAGEPRLHIIDEVHNLSPEAVPLIWVQHPGFGQPFVDALTRIDTGAQRFHADERFDMAANPFAPGSAGDWPLVADRAGHPVDLRQVPALAEQRSVLGYLHDFAEGGWFALTSPMHGFGVGLTWPTAIFPHAWFWQEAHGSPGFPWFRRAYVVAVEPATSTPNHGLATLIERGETPLWLAGGQTIRADFTVVCYEGVRAVAHISLDGTVTASEEA